MKQEKKTILVNVLTADSIESKGSWGFNLNDNRVACDTCLSPLFYIARHYGVIEETSTLGSGIVGYILKNKYLMVREVGLCVYCAQCGEFQDDYDTWVYPDEKIICTWRDDELDYAERELIESALDCYNRTGEVKGRYESSELVFLRDKIKEYEKKNNIDIEKLRSELKKTKKKKKNVKRTAKRESKNQA